MSCIRNIYIDTCIRLPSQDFSQEPLVQCIGEVLYTLYTKHYLQVILVRVLTLFPFYIYFRKTIALNDTKTMGATWNLVLWSLTPMEGVLTQPRQNTNTCQNTTKFTCLILYGQHSYGTWRYIWKHSTIHLRYEANHLMRLIVTYLPSMGRDTPHFNFTRF